MKLVFEPMTLEYAKAISMWKYDGFVKNIYVKPYFDNYNQYTKTTKGPNNCHGFAVLFNGDLFGLFEYYINNIMEIGLAINPKYINKGFGKDFVLTGIKYGIEMFNYNKDFIVLNVNECNIPAIRVYEKCGFIVYKDGKNIEMRKYI